MLVNNDRKKSTILLYHGREESNRLELDLFSCLPVVLEQISAPRSKRWVLANEAYPEIDLSIRSRKTDTRDFLVYRHRNSNVPEKPNLKLRRQRQLCF